MIANSPSTILRALLVAVLLTPAPLRGQEEPDSLPSLLQRRVEAGVATGALWAGEQRLTAERSLPSFYRARSFAPAWSAGGRPTRAVGALLRAIEEAALDGLDARDYHLEPLRALVGRGPRATVPELADLDLLATDAFLVLGSHLLHGRVDPVQVRAEWLANRRGADMAAVLAEALEGDAVAEALDRLRPSQPRYARMREALARLRQVEASGGWPRLGDGPTLRVGDTGPRVRTLRARLAASGDLVDEGDEAAAEDVFDPTLEAAVRRFQSRHGLDADGVVGAGTRAALDVPVGARIERLVVNLERWRWLPAELGRRHILVNIPDYAVVVREDGVPVLRLRAIVGRAYRQTPVFTASMGYLVLSPFWHVPPGIAANDQLPLIRANPSAIAAQRMTLLDRRTNAVVDPATIDWSSMTAERFNQEYRLRQDPGPANALGDVKFMFPNTWNVYLHDTPARELFGSTERAFSSGCIRVDRPLELAAWLLRELPGWDADRIRRTVDARTETTVTLPAPVPVHLQYLTAFVDDEGLLHFRRDLYERDAAVLAALRSDPPGV